MSRVLTIALVVLGGASALLWVMAGQVVVGTVIYVVPRPVVSLIPTAFFYLLIFAAGWFAFARQTQFWRAASGHAWAVVAGFGLPLALNMATEYTLAAHAKRELEPTLPIGPVETIAIDPDPGLWHPGVCDDFCQLLLYNASARRVVVLPPRDRTDMRLRSPYPAMAFTIARLRTCPSADTYIERSGLHAWTPFQMDIMRAVRLRIAAGECLVASNEDINEANAQSDLTIRRLDAGNSSELDWLPLPGAVQSQTLEMIKDREVLARAVGRQTWLFSIPLRLKPHGGAHRMDGLTWERRSIDAAKLDVLDAVDRFTTYDLRILQGG